MNAVGESIASKVCHSDASVDGVATIVTSGIEGVGHPAAFVLGGGVGVESVGYALTLAADGQSATTAPCETFGSPSLARSNSGDASGGAGDIVHVQVARLELILLTDVFAA